ncbi:MAG: alkaline phosphatase [Verrucomicrobia bacterium]|nr:alkaline phosphatase [Verrucomicrobiota bacterium]
MNRPNRFLLWLARLPLVLVVIGFSLHPISAQPAKNIILFIGDGMGFEQVKAARFYNGAPLSFGALPGQADCTTHSADNAITDSAASGTAIATGVKVNNGVISLAIPGDGRELETLLEFYQKKNLRVGLITTAYLTHATPAVFAAHESSRNNYSQIGQDYLTQTLPNLLFGGGGNGLDPASTQAAGYVVVTDTAGFNSLNTTADYLSAQFGTVYMPYEEDYLGGGYPYPHLTDMTVKALAALGSHPDGFFLMIEAARIDHACHDNRLPEAVHETLELSRAVQAALNWANGRTDTTILVTSDHETGGLTVTGNNGAGNYPSVTWSSTDHTAANVPVYAWGVNASLVSGTLDNTDFFNLLTAENSSSPVLARVSATVLNETTVEITWLTDVAASSTVEFGLAPGSYGAPVTDAALVTDHAVLLEGLTADQLYYYRVKSHDGLSQSTSAEYTFTPTSQLEPGTLIAAGSVWKYNATGTDLGTAWREPGYDDSGWPSGPAQLGYGGKGEVTNIRPAGTPVYPCYYFRQTFNVSDPADYGSLALSIHRDDGAVVYLNGTEVARYNLPTGTIPYNTWALTASDFPWDPAITIPNLLVAGDNVIQVQVHQASVTSSDVVFDLELIAEPPAPPSITLVPTGGSWKYHDDGINLLTAWREPGYVEDGTWAEGPAPLGYDGTYAIATQISYGPSATSKYICYYFRRGFTVTDPSAFGDLSLRIHRDDGAVVYLNGTEIARYNMPSGTISYSTYASTASDFDWDPARTIPNTLVPGPNVLAVEVHQANASSSDLVMNLELTALLEPDAIPPVLSTVTATDVTDRSATIVWTTDEPADSRVDYGLTEDYGHSTGTATLVTEHSVQLTGLAAATDYRYVVSSMDAFGNVGYGPDLSFTTLDRIQHPPTAPASLVAIPGVQSVKLTWLPSTDPDGDLLVYDVFRRLEGQVHDTYPLARLTGTTFTDTGLIDGVECYYVVRCVDVTGRFANSLEVSATPNAHAYDAYVIQNPTVSPGAFEGDYRATLPADVAGSQTLGVTSK